MKKIIALVVAIVMLAAMAVPAFAATGFNGGAGENKNQTLLSYGVSKAYVVNVPASVNLNEGTAVEVSVDAGYAIAIDETLTITVESANDWALKDADTSSTNTATIAYDITEGGVSVKTDPVILEATANADSAAVTSNLAVALTGKIPSIVATYTDLLTFTVDLVKADA